MTGVLLALGASLAWGISDFLAGVAARHAGTLAVSLLSQLVGVALGVVWVASSGDPLPGARSLTFAAVAGVSVLLGLGLFYRAMAIGTMSIVTPIVATGAAVPVLAGLAGGDDPSTLQLIGMPLAVAGVALAAHQTGRHAARPERARESILLALAAAGGAGIFMWFMEPAGRESVPWAVLVARGAAAPLFALLVVGMRAPLAPALRPRLGLATVGVGALGFAAIALYTAATQADDLSVVSVLGSLYPAVTILLARATLGERLHRLQEVGVVTVLAGVVLITAG